MTWIRVDDQMPDHPKIEPLSDSAFRWIFRGLSYANRFLTDGVLPAVFLARVPESVKTELAEAGVWRQVRGRTRIHDYSDYQLSKVEIQEQRKKNRERQAKFRQSQKNNGVTNTAPSRPGPSVAKEPPKPPAGAGGRRRRRKAPVVPISAASPESIDDAIRTAARRDELKAQGLSTGEISEQLEREAEARVS